MGAAFVLWRRLDTPGHDACRLARSAAGWQIDGTAVFREDGVPARLDYQVGCDFEWVTAQGYVRGWLGVQTVEFTFVRSAGGVWTINGVVIPGAGELRRSRSRLHPCDEPAADPAPGFGRGSGSAGAGRLA